MKQTALNVLARLNLKNIEYKPVFFTSLKTYNKDTFMKDLIAGVMVGVVALPLAIAFGIASGVTPDQGIISCIIAGIFVSIFGGSNHQISGPTGALIVIVGGIVGTYGLEGLMIATFISGVILILMGLFKAGSIIKFIPYPIVIGFTSGVAVTIFTTQVKDILGLPLESIPTSFIEKWIVYFSNIHLTNFWSLGITILTIIIINFCIKINNRLPSFLIAIIIMTIASFVLRNYFNITTVQTIGDKFVINAAIPKPTNIGLTFESIRNLFSAGITIAIFGSIVTLLSATVADGATSEKHNPNDELVGQGIANVISPIFGGIPITGAIARTLTNINNGGTTPVSGIIHAIVLLMILLFLGNLSKHIPIACLGGILAIIAYNMANWRLFVSLMKSHKADVLVLVVTFLLTVIFDLTIAIELGLMLAVFLFIRRTSETTVISDITNGVDNAESHNPVSDIDEEIPKDVEIYEIEGPFFFGIANKFDELQKNVSNKRKIRIVRMRSVPFIDSTGLHNFETMIKSSHRHKIKFILSGVKPSVRETLVEAGLMNLLGEENVCDSIKTALARAKVIIKENNENNTKTK
ncbi:MAG: SulP family inorganic anion transporter [Rikenellaceae bacterium]